MLRWQRCCHASPCVPTHPLCVALQVLRAYLPNATKTHQVLTMDFSGVGHGRGCHADLVIYLAATTYFCTDIHFVEDANDTTLSTNKDYLAIHAATRDIVRGVVRQRGLRHSTGAKHGLEE